MLDFSFYCFFFEWENFYRGTGTYILKLVTGADEKTQQQKSRDTVSLSDMCMVVVPAWLGLAGWQAVQLCAEIVEPDHGAVGALLLGMLSPINKPKYVR